jgi:hypothetical protein
MKILVVEDDPRISDVLVYALKADGLDGRIRCSIGAVECCSSAVETGNGVMASEW